MNPDEIIKQLDLNPHPEGGFYRETYRSGEKIDASTGTKSVSTAIYYMLVPGAVSHFHRLKDDEIFHFYQGDPVEWFLLCPGAAPERKILGPVSENGALPQMIIKAGTWFAGCLVEGGQYALMGTTMAPGFEFADFELGKKEDLLRAFPESAEEIKRFT